MPSSGPAVCPSILQHFLYWLGVSVIQAEPLAVGDHIRQRLVGNLSLAVAILHEVIEADTSVLVRLVERNHAFLKQPDQRSSRDA